MGIRPPTIAIGLDAAEPTFVRRLIDQGTMPGLASLLDAGASWLKVESPADIGSGAVWPTFLTGQTAAEHCLHSVWRWRADTMALESAGYSALQPFWASAVHDGTVFGVLDVPYAPLVGLASGFEVSEWGSHDVLVGKMCFSPATLDSVIDTVPRHPLSQSRLDVEGPDDTSGLARLAAGCLAGVEKRGELAARLIRETRPDVTLCVFSELHHAAHPLWHTVERDHALYADALFHRQPAISPTLEEIFRAVDRAVVRIVDAAGPDATVVVFSLHGMRPCRGVPSWLSAVLADKGWCALSEFSAQTGRERAASMLSGLKRMAPRFAKRLYYRAMPISVTNRLARPTMMPAYDWARTSAFALPTDQHGWIRINLKGREILGRVDERDYVDACDRLEQMLRALVTTDGRALVGHVLRTAASVVDALRSSLPDLIVHWTDAAFDLSPRISGVSTPLTSPIALKLTGQHAPEGFCVVTDAGARAGTTIRASDLHRLILGAVTA